MHQCPIDRCLQEIPNEWLMCTTHWAQVRQFLRERVVKARLRRSNSAAALRQYNAACRAAINSVESDQPAMAVS